MRFQQKLYLALMVFLSPQLLMAESASEQTHLSSTLNSIAAFGAEYSSGLMMLFAIGLVFIGMRRKQHKDGSTNGSHRRHHSRPSSHASSHTGSGAASAKHSH